VGDLFFCAQENFGIAVGPGNGYRCRAVRLWTLQRNATARRFYEKHRFALIKKTDGTGDRRPDLTIAHLWHRAKSFGQRNKFLTSRRSPPGKMTPSGRIVTCRRVIPSPSESAL
jgi:hypothetical protein